MANTDREVERLRVLIGLVETRLGQFEPFPFGAVFISVVDTDPALLIGYGTWARIGEGRVLVGVDEGDPDFEEPELTGGAKAVTLTEDEMPDHTHVQDAHHHGQRVKDSGADGAAGARGGSGANDTSVGQTADATATNQNTGGGAAHENMPPFLSVYMWKRTA